MATRKTTTKKATKPAAKKTKAAGDKSAKKLSQIDAAARVLAEANGPMACKEIVEAMQTKG